MKTIIFDLIDTLAYLDGIGEATQALKERLGSKRFDVLWGNGQLDKDASIEAVLQRIRQADSFSAAEEVAIVAWLDFSNAVLYPETLTTLQRLKDQHYTLAVLSNSPATHRDQLADLGIAQYIDYPVFSFEVGFRKPESKMFQTMIQRLQVDPAEILMVGDSMELDIVPAQKLGMQTVLMDRDGQSDLEQTIKSLDKLVDWLADNHDVD